MNKMNRVKADLQCPFCGHCKVVKVGANRKAITCPSCKQAVFLSWATGIEGETDEHGYYFHAVEDSPPKHSFTIRNKMRG